jgi:MFS family permease
VLPTYASVGVAAPLLLVFLYVLQGISVGGEYGGAVLMAIEHSEPAGVATAAAGCRWARPPA